MSNFRQLNLYCDESCYLLNDHIPVMVLGALSCQTADARRFADAIRDIKQRYGLQPTFEVKWTKVSPARADFYEALIDYFIKEPELRFRGLVVPDKNELDHERFGQSHDDFYGKMYYLMLRYLVTPPHRYHVYMDIKDTRGGERTRLLHDVLANSFHDFHKESIRRVQQIRSEESELLQLADLIIGALGYANRALSGSPAKVAIVKRLEAKFGTGALARTSAFTNVKFNILRWESRHAT